MNTLLADIKETRERAAIHQAHHKRERRERRKISRRVAILRIVNRMLERIGL